MRRNETSLILKILFRFWTEQKGELRPAKKTVTSTYASRDRLYGEVKAVTKLELLRDRLYGDLKAVTLRGEPTSQLEKGSEGGDEPCGCGAF